MDRIEETLKAVKPSGEPAELLRKADGTPLSRGLFVAAADHAVKPGDFCRFHLGSTANIVKSFYAGDLGVALLAPKLRVLAILADFGVKDCPPHPDGCWAEAVKAEIGRVEDVTERAAMTRETALECIQQGAATAREFIAAHDIKILGVGAFGAGSEVSSTVMAAVFAEKSVDEVVDPHRRGARELADLVQGALRRQSPDPLDGVDLLAEYGGLETGGIAGAILGAAGAGVPVVLDGLTSLAAAAVAVDVAPAAAGYLFASAGASCRASAVLLGRLRLRPLLGFDLPLDDGSAACLGIELAEACQGIATGTRIC